MFRFLFILSCVFSSYLSAIDDRAEYQIIFIHLGKKLPDYLPLSLQQAHLFNPEAGLILIANQEAIEDIDFTFDGLTVIAAEQISKTEEHKQFITKSKLDRRWRKGFWFYTTERLFYLDDFITQYDLKNTFHVENDNLIYVNLAELLPIFVKNYQGIAAPFESDERGAASFIFVADRKSIHAFSKYLLENVNARKCDMLLLNAFKNQFGVDLIAHLPTIMKDYWKDRALISLEGKKSTIDPALYSNNVEQFQSLFDACLYGQFFGGIDPRNGLAGPGYLNPEAVFNCSHMVMEWQIDPWGRKIPFASYGGKRYRLNNLHIHSKDLKPHTSIPFN